MHQPIKSVKEYTIQNSVMFACVMEDPDICKAFLEKIFPDKKVKSLSLTEGLTLTAEKSLLFSPDLKVVRLDVIFENDEAMYDIEMQTYHEGELPFRIRYYASAMDVKSLKAGETYSNLKHSYIIFISTKDYWGLDQPIYQFENIDFENHLYLGDKSYKIVVNTSCSRERVPEELRPLYEYIQNDRMTGEDELVTKIDDRICEILDRSRRENSMTLFEQIEIWKKQKEDWEAEKEELKVKAENAREEGIAEGLKEGAIRTARGFKEDGIPLEIIAKNTGLTVEEIEAL